MQMLQLAILAHHHELDKLQTEIDLKINCKKKLMELENQQIKKNLKTEFNQRIEELNLLSETINSLASRLEIELNNFREVAAETNKIYYHIQDESDFQVDKSHRYRLSYRSIWQVHYSAVPYILVKEGKFIVMQRMIDLFKHDRQRTNKIDQNNTIFR